MELSQIKRPMFLRVSFTGGIPVLAMSAVSRCINADGGRVIYEGRLPHKFFDVFPNNAGQLLESLDCLNEYKPESGGNILSVCLYPLTKKVYNRVFRSE